MEMSEMIDYELNKAIAELVYPNNEFERYARGKSNSVCLLDEPTEFQTIVNYCESWESLMPLVVEHGIDLKHPNNKRHTYLIGNNTPFPIRCDKNPQRALAECLLQVLRDKKDN